MLIFQKAIKGELECEGLAKIANVCDVTAEGVKGSKEFLRSQSRGAEQRSEIRARNQSRTREKTKGGGRAEGKKSGIQRKSILVPLEGQIEGIGKSASMCFFSFFFAFFERAP